MNVRIRIKTGELRNGVPYVLSLLIHGVAISWLLFGPSLDRGEAPVSIYEAQIRPNERRIVWYRKTDRLPDISPAGPRAPAPTPPRARRKFTQTIVAGEKDDVTPSTMIRTPAPEIQGAKLPPLPNLVAVTESRRPVRRFERPEVKTSAAPAPALPDAPRPAPTVLKDGSALTASLAAPVRKFEPPPGKVQAATLPALPDAPRPATTMLADGTVLTASLAAPVRKFELPPGKVQAAALPTLPDAPRPAPIVLPDGTVLTGGLTAPVRQFATPAGRAQTGTLPALPDAPLASSRLDGQGLTLPEGDLRAPTRSFQAPQAAAGRPPSFAAELGEAPAAAAAIPEAGASLAIVSLNPAKLPAPPVAPGAHDAGFSAGPKPREGGGAAAGTEAAIAVPGLLTRDGARDPQPSLVAGVVPSRRNLMAGLRNPPPAGALPEAASPGAPHVSSAPEPQLAGRIVYSIAIQMPNITSYTGSWMVWFAEREVDARTARGEVKAPVPLRKVDPRYVAAAADERVEGVVRLSAVIRKDGHVEAVTVVRHLDDRLDSSAREALAKWQFEPALRNGAPVAVDAIFEVPFRLLPRPVK